MREILFRGFTADENGTEKGFIKNEWVKGRWVYGDLIHRRIWGNTFPVIRTQDSGFDNYDDVEVFFQTVGQYTGLTDKNGRKIFEGDVVRYAYRDEEGRNAEVVYRPSEFLLRFNETYQKYPQAGLLVQFNSNSIEVIGNIYDNPELMEVKENG